MYIWAYLILMAPCWGVHPTMINSKKSGSAPSPAPPMHLLGGLHLDSSGVDASGVDASGDPGILLE